MKHRKLRIAWSVACSIIAVLLMRFGCGVIGGWIAAMAAWRIAAVLLHEIAGEVHSITS
jgi:hypothetical protein